MGTLFEARSWSVSEFTPLLKQQSLGVRPVLGFAGSASVAFAHRQNSASPVADTSGAETNSGIHFYHHELLQVKSNKSASKLLQLFIGPFQVNLLPASLAGLRALLLNSLRNQMGGSQGHLRHFREFFLSDIG